MSEQRSTTTRLVCPECGASDVIPIVYGLPTYETHQRAESGEFALGGCFLSDESPGWLCQACHKRFGSVSEGEPSGSSYRQALTALGMFVDDEDDPASPHTSD
jgi:transposase-like protein